MNIICHRLLIKASPAKVYEALTTEQGLAGWWTPETEAEPGIGNIARFAFGAKYFKEMKITKLEPSRTVEWRCVKGYEDWVDTKVRFELRANNKGTDLMLYHDGWKEFTPSFASCSYDWALFMRSLRLLCETGQGTPYPNFQ